MDWQKLKDNIYYSDGSLRDIYVQNTTKDDWQTWADFVNTNYKTSFHIYETEVKEGTVDLSKVFDYWNGVHDTCPMATVYVGDILVNSYFFGDTEIENDITPKEINSIEDHNKLLEYLIGLSKALNKKVILTPETTPETILISVDKDNVEINFG